MAEKHFHVFVGTKGQLIKMAPIMLEMDRRGIEYNYVNASQHTKILDEISDLFELKKPDFVLESVGKDVTNVREMLCWGSKNIWKYGLSKKHRIFMRDKNGAILLVHGDAPPALLGLILGKLNKLKIAHVEAGLRSCSIVQPFPEEIIRIIVDKKSDYLFSDGVNRGYQNLLREKVKGEIYDTALNTIFDAVRLATLSMKSISAPREEYVLVSFHRFETISSKKRMKTIVNVLNAISKDKFILFPLHESTREKLESFGLLNSIEKNTNIQTMQLMDYFSFVIFIKNAIYIITDGGGPQEESYYLGTPCLLLREYTERTINPNTCLAGFDENKIRMFIRSHENYRTDNFLKEFKDYSPSKKIVDVLLQYQKQCQNKNDLNDIKNFKK